MKNFIKYKLPKLFVVSLVLILQIYNLCSISIEAGELHAIIVGDTDHKAHWGYPGQAFSYEAMDIETIQQESKQD